MHLNRLPVHKLSKDIGHSIRAVKVVQVKLGLVLRNKARPFIKIENKYYSYQQIVNFCVYCNNIKPVQNGINRQKLSYYPMTPT